MKKGIVSFDIDMTLLDHKDYKIPESAMKAVSLLRENYYVVVGTGRDMDAPYSEGILDGVNPDAVINQNGARVTAGDEVIYEHYMDSATVDALFLYAKDKPFAVGTVIGKHDCYINPQYVTIHDMVRWNTSQRSFIDPALIKGKKVRSLAFIGPPDWAAHIEEDFPGLRLPLFASRLGADIVEADVSKAEGLKRLCEYWGIDINNTFAFGDSLNDIEIIKEAGVGIAMGNSFQDLKEAADYVTAPIGEDGIYKACISLGLIKDS